MSNRHYPTPRVPADKRPKNDEFPARKRWNKEYRTHEAIPSSHRRNPSKALIAAASAINYSEIETVLDVGCGNGRNAVYLAEKGLDVIAVDFASEAINLAQNYIAHKGTSGSIECIQCDVRNQIPTQEDTVDLVIDSYTSCHFINDKDIKEHLKNVERVLRPGGQFYWSALSPDDEYYSQLTDTHPETDIIVDPLNNMPKRLYSQESVKKDLPTDLNIELTLNIRFADLVDGTEYWRSIVTGVFEK